MLKYITIGFFTLLAQMQAATADEIVIPHTFTDGTPAIAAQVNENLEVLRAALEQALDQINQDSLGVTPVGGIIMFYRDAAEIPENWLLCDGQQVLDPTSPIYQSFTPDLVNRFARGAGASGELLTGGSDFHSHSLDIARDSVKDPRQIYQDVGISNSGPAGVSNRYYPLAWDKEEGGTIYNSHGHIGSATGVTHLPSYARVRFIMRIR